MDCPKSAAITLSDVECVDNIESIGKILIRRRGNAELAATDLTTKAGIDALLAASDDTKVVVSPFLYSNTAEPGGVVDDDKNFAGQPVRVSEESTIVNSKLMLTSAVYDQMKDLEGENLEVFIISEGDLIFCKTGDTADHYEGIPISGMFTSALRLGGHGKADECDFIFNFRSDWFSGVSKVTPTDYSPLYDLVNP